jgi:ACR3 family arsenite transporter
VNVASTVAVLERHQVWLYLLALVVGAGAGLTDPALTGPAEALVNPLLGLLLYATFLAVPFRRLGSALRDGRFLLTVAVVDFVFVPLVVWLITRPLAGDDPVDRALLVGVLFVLLAPCVDYVIVFTGLAGGAADRLLAATPLLMLAQIVLLPVWLRLFAGAEVVRSVDPAPFVSAFFWLIVVPLVAAAVTQQLGGVGRRVSHGMGVAMVPLMMAVLAVVVASQIDRVTGQWSDLVRVVPVYVVFAVVMGVVGLVAGRLAGLDVPGVRAVMFTGVTRNALVILPVVLALPAAYRLAPAVVVTQTLVELLVMVVMVTVVPKLVR